MYERKIGEQTLTLGNDRWKRDESLVLYDVETGTQWIQASGKAFRGALAHHELKVVPVELTRFAAFKANHPEASVLTGARTSAPRGRIQLLNRDHLAELLLVGRVRAEARAYPLAELDRLGLIEDSIDATPVAVVFAREPDVMRIYRREVAGVSLELELVRRAGAVVLRERGGQREWDAATGRTLDDARAPDLEALPAIPLLRDRLKQHFRRGTLWEAPTPKRPGS